MNIKSKLLELLEENMDGYISGADLAKELSVSRNAVWKAVEALRLDGYGISAVTNKGYRLETQGDLLTAAGIMRYLRDPGFFHAEVRKSVTSTNTVLRELAAKGAPEGYVLAAREQTAGKGRLGRGFHSPAGHGVYFSLLLRPGSKVKEPALITSAAAVAAARAIEEVVGVSVSIKWVNDLFVDGRKICGILTEASFDMESGCIESAVLGIGINITRPEEGYPEEIADVATSLTYRHSGRDNERCRLIAATLDNFREFYQNLSARGFLDEYRTRSAILGKEIYVSQHDGEKPARAVEIDDECRLVVKYDSGETAALSTGEVSVKWRK